MEVHAHIIYYVGGGIISICLGWKSMSTLLNWWWGTRRGIRELGGDEDSVRLVVVDGNSN